MHDVVLVPELFCDVDDKSVYANLLKEIRAAGQDSLWASWHGDSHLIADDTRMGGKWKDMSPTFLAGVQPSSLRYIHQHQFVRSVYRRQ